MGLLQQTCRAIVLHPFQLALEKAASQQRVHLLLAKDETALQLWNIPSSTTDRPAHSKSAYQEAPQLNLNGR